MNRDLKNTVDSMCVKIETIGKLIGRKNLREEAVLEMAQYLMYLSVADGDVEWSEVGIINQYLDLHLVPGEVQRYIETNRDLFKNMRDNVPQVFALLVDMDKQFCKKGVISKPYASELMIAIYRELGREIVHADAEFEMKERIHFYMYMNVLETYWERQLIGN